MYKSIDDARNKIIETARQRVEPLIQNAESRANVAQREIGKTADKVADLNKAVSGLDSKLAMALEKVGKYEKRMQDYEARISKSGSTALAQVETIKMSSDEALKEIAQLRETMNRQQKSLNETGTLVLDNPLNLLSQSRGSLHSTQGTPPTLFQLTPKELRAVSSLSPVGFQDVSTAPKPTCTTANRGTFYVEKGIVRVADRPFLYVKKSDTTYEWIQLGIIP